MKKAIFVLPSLGHGGAERQAARIIPLIDQLEILVVVVKPGGTYEKNLINLGIKIVSLNEISKGSSMKLLWSSLGRFSQIVKDYKPDVLVSFLTNINIFVFIAKLLYALKPIQISCIQNNIKAELSNTPTLLRLFNRFLLPIAFKKSKCVISLSHGVAQGIRSTLNYKVDNIEVIHNAGYDDELFENANEPLSKPVYSNMNSFKLITVGRFEKQKDHQTLLLAIKHLKQEISDFELIIVGKGRLEDEILRKIDEYGLSKHVKLIGFQSNPFKYIKSANCFLLSSSWEGFANVIVESLACGVPVISSNCDYGPSEIIDHGFNGLLFQVGDHLAMASHIKAFYENE
jgi:glycosyltransferase involved in cell wall biosynthesis